MERIRLKPDFEDTIARETKLSLAQYCKLAGVSKSTVHALRNPSQHPHRKGGMLRHTAWKLVTPLSELTHITLEEAWDKLLYIEHIEDNQKQHAEDT